MDAAVLSLRLTPHGKLVLVSDGSASGDKLQKAFDHGSGHGLLLLGLDLAGTSLPPVLAWWREFAARYVTALCMQPENVAAPGADELQAIALSAPPLTGAEYLTEGVILALWHDLDKAFRTELAECDCGVQEFLK